MSEVQVGGSTPIVPRGSHPSAPTHNMSTLADLESDRSGYETFSRYRWQAKQSAWQWLTCLGSIQPPLAILCEHVEDIVIVYESKLRFAQLKTRDKGSWSASKVCSEGHGIDALVRSFLEAEIHGLHEISTFELWLEGPMAETRETVSFFAEPSTAGAKLRNKIMDLGMPGAKLASFLDRLIIKPNQPTRIHIDAVILQYIGALWPALTTPERQNIFSSLLEAAQHAQANEANLSNIVARLAEHIHDSPKSVSASVTKEAFGLASLDNQTLTRASLLSMVPPLPDSSREDLLGRIREGTVTSALELKMRAAGVSKESIDIAQGLRADAETVRQEILSSSPDAGVRILKLEKRVLQTAEATASRARMMAGGNPAIAARPGEFVMAELLGQPANLSYLDRDGLFQGESDLVFGFLCHISDTCKYWWQAS